jgi:hypothetical protein
MSCSHLGVGERPHHRRGRSGERSGDKRQICRLFSEPDVRTPIEGFASYSAPGGGGAQKRLANGHDHARGRQPQPRDDDFVAKANGHDSDVEKAWAAAASYRK